VDDVNGPKDRPFPATSDADAAKLDEAISALVERAKTTYPAAKQRFLAGLPPKERFFVTTRIQEGHQFEQIFVLVRAIADGLIHGTVASDIHLVKSVKARAPIAVAEDQIVDWMIAKPDGSEEGNIVGKFLDTYARAR
jgi:hypothetical protein